MLILPTSDPQRAKTLLGQLAADRRHCAIIVFGDSERAREIASRADVRAEGHPFRRVVLVPSPQVLAGEPQFAPLLRAQAGGAEAVTVTLDFKPSRALSGDEALDFFVLEKAFAAALAGEVLAT
jgi:hypothetical protein